MASGASVNINDPKTIRLATYSALNKMLKQNFTPSKFTKDNGYQLTKHGIENEFKLLLEKIRSNKKNDLQNSKQELKEFLANEIVSRYYYQEGRIIERLQHDKDIEESLRLLENLDEYESILKVDEQ